MNQLNDVGLKATNDNNVLSSEKDEIRSDLKAIEIRWTSIGKNTAKLDQRCTYFFYLYMALENAVDSVHLFKRV